MRHVLQTQRPAARRCLRLAAQTITQRSNKWRWRGVRRELAARGWCVDVSLRAIRNMCESATTGARWSTSMLNAVQINSSLSALGATSDTVGTDGGGGPLDGPIAQHRGEPLLVADLHEHKLHLLAHLRRRGGGRATGSSSSCAAGGEVKFNRLHCPDVPHRIARVLGGI